MCSAGKVQQGSMYVLELSPVATRSKEIYEELAQQAALEQKVSLLAFPLATP